MSAAAHVFRLGQTFREVKLAGLAGISFANEEKTRPQEEFERGRRAGEQALQEQLLKQRTELLELQNGVLKAMQQALPQVVRECEQTLIAICLEAARKLVAGMPVSTEMVEAVVREALSQTQEATEHHIYLHPEDLSLLEGANSQMLKQNSEHHDVHFYSSPEVSRGGALVKTRFGITDARRETRLELLQKSMLA